jgi:hypothetical protein
MTRRSLPRARAVAAATIAVFLAIFALLVFQLRSGRDPALGQGTTLAKAPVPPPKRILVRKTIVTRVIVHLPADEEDAPVAVAAAPAVTYSAPAPAAAAPAPAPAPAPLTTHSS